MEFDTVDIRGVALRMNEGLYVLYFTHYHGHSCMYFSTNAGCTFHNSLDVLYIQTIVKSNIALC